MRRLACNSRPKTAAVPDAVMLTRPEQNTDRQGHSAKAIPQCKGYEKMKARTSVFRMDLRAQFHSSF